jgi:hypothetical protein
MLYLADTVQRRGRLFHSELNLPVYQSLQNLSSAVSVSSQLKPLSTRAILMLQAELWPRSHIEEPDPEKQYHPHFDDRQCHCQGTECMGQQPELPRQERDFELVWLNRVGPSVTAHEDVSSLAQLTHLTVFLNYLYRLPLR